MEVLIPEAEDEDEAEEEEEAEKEEEEEEPEEEEEEEDRGTDVEEHEAAAAEEQKEEEEEDELTMGTDGQCAKEDDAEIMCKSEGTRLASERALKEPLMLLLCETSILLSKLSFS